MPFKSQAQRRWMYWAESHDEVPKGTAAKWEAHTPKGKKLPERVKKKAGVAEDGRLNWLFDLAKAAAQYIRQSD